MRKGRITILPPKRPRGLQKLPMKKKKLNPWGRRGALGGSLHSVRGENP